MNRHRTHPTTTAKLRKRTILVVASETVEGATLCDLMRLRAGEPAAEVLVIAPALNSRLRHWLSDEDAARRRAGLRLRACLEHLGAAGIQAEGLVGDADPLQAITDALREFGAHEIVLAAHRQARPHWLTHDLAGRARQRFAQPVVHLDGEPSDDSSSSQPVPLPARSAETPTRSRLAGWHRRPRTAERVGEVQIP